MYQPFLTPQELADLLGISRTSVYRLIQRGELQALRIGKRTIRIHPNSVKLFQEQRQ